MKKIFIIALTLIGIFSGCKKAEITKNDLGQEEKECLVTFNPIGDITTSMSPLSKAPFTDDMYLVQVYKGTDPFAFGYFDNLESMKLYLKQGSKYRIIIAMIKDAKTLLGNRYCLSQNSIESNSGSDSFSIDYGHLDDYFPLNIYQYNFSKKLQNYQSKTSSSLYYYDYSVFKLNRNDIGILNGVVYPTCTDWFYGEVNDYSPTGDYSTLNMSFKRVGFKLKYELSGVTDGEVTVRVYNTKRTFIDNTTNTSTYSSDTQFIAFYDTKSAWQYADDYSENMDVAVVWKRGIGVTQDLGKKTIQVKRNCLNNIKIALGSDDRGAGVKMSMESESTMGNLDTNIPIQ